MKPDPCKVPGCPNRLHAQGLCRRHYDQWRANIDRNPDAPAEELRPDQHALGQRDRWLLGWLMEGKGPPLMPEVCPWRCEYHLRTGIPQVDRFLDPTEIEADWNRHRDALLARGEETGRVPWAATYFEPKEAAA